MTRVTLWLWEVWADYESLRKCEGGCGFVRQCATQVQERGRSRWLCRACFDSSAEHDRLLRLLGASNGDAEHARAVERALR